MPLQAGATGAGFHPERVMRGAAASAIVRQRDPAVSMSALIWILLAMAYIAVFFWLGLATLRNGHGFLFFLGIFIPLFWIFGALSGPSATATGR